MKTNKWVVFIFSFLIYFVIMNLLYLYDKYVSFLMNLICGGMILSVLIISLISELIQNSKIPKSYFYGITGCLIASIVCVVLLKYKLN